MVRVLIKGGVTDFTTRQSGPDGTVRFAGDM